jgi:hypothetical protein
VLGRRGKGGRHCQRIIHCPTECTKIWGSRATTQPGMACKRKEMTRAAHGPGGMLGAPVRGGGGSTGRRQLNLLAAICEWRYPPGQSIYVRRGLLEAASSFKPPHDGEERRLRLRPCHSGGRQWRCARVPPCCLSLWSAGEGRLVGPQPLPIEIRARVVQPAHLPQEARLGDLAHPGQHSEVIGTLHRPADGGWHWQRRRTVAATACCLVPPRSVAPPNQPATASHL